ncbi:hypothetical protein DSOL_5047 [Desulfosporosinus metallidurans]|uniref:Uncharacterized protein n=1 Tax=Desulfosporosinus metallidurans TaxID=1888891 RepID=A0A1Q8QG18_9FIRM|nr:hypothetical protein DSOL_5047 [Desulfosporosinus metallidurans]
MPTLSASRFDDLFNKSIPALTEKNEGLATFVFFVSGFPEWGRGVQ